MHQTGDTKQFRRCWIKVLRHQAKKSDSFRYNNWPGPISDNVPVKDAPSFPAYRIELWKDIATNELSNPNFSSPDGITLVGPVTSTVMRLLLQRPDYHRICAWFNVQLCKGEVVTFHSQDWGEHTQLNITSEELRLLGIPSVYID